MNKMFICTERDFPRGDAGANYIQYFALSLIHVGWDVTVISCGKPQKNYENNYKGIKCVHIRMSNNKYIRYLQFAYGIASLFSEALKDNGCNKDSYISFYTYNINLVKGILKKWKIIPQSHMAIFCVEWYQRENYINDKRGKRYKKYLKFFETAYQMCGKVFAISKLIEKHFKQMGKKVMRLPIMADPFEYVSDKEILETKKRSRGNHYIYSGNAENKDSFYVMLESVRRAKEKTSKEVFFHLTGIKMSRLEQILGENKRIIRELGESLIVHPWLEYNQLIELFKSIDFLLLPREDSFSNRANFPSKIPEMMSYGIIPICSNVGDYTNGYLSANEDSILMNGCSIDECEKAIIQSLNMGSAKRTDMAICARATSKRIFYYKHWSNQIETFLLDK